MPRSPSRLKRCKPCQIYRQMYNFFCYGTWLFCTAMKGRILDCLLYLFFLHEFLWAAATFALPWRILWIEIKKLKYSFIPSKTGAPWSQQFTDKRKPEGDANLLVKGLIEIIDCALQEWHSAKAAVQVCVSYISLLLVLTWSSLLLTQICCPWCIV